MTLLESILLVLLLGSWFDLIRMYRRKNDAIAGWDRAIEKLLHCAERNHQLENQISAMTSRRYEGN